MKKIQVKSIKVQYRERGIWTGQYEFQILQIDHSSSSFKGCPMGRGRDEYDAMVDFARRVNIENSLSISPRDLDVVVQEDRST